MQRSLGHYFLLSLCLLISSTQHAHTRADIHQSRACKSLVAGAFATALIAYLDSAIAAKQDLLAHLHHTASRYTKTPALLLRQDNSEVATEIKTLRKKVKSLRKLKLFVRLAQIAGISSMAWYMFQASLTKQYDMVLSFSERERKRRNTIPPKTPLRKRRRTGGLDHPPVPTTILTGPDAAPETPTTGHVTRSELYADL